MQRPSEPHNAHAILRKFANGRNLAGLVESLVGKKRISSASPEELIDELARCFCYLQEAFKSGAVDSGAAPSLVEGLCEVAGRHGISAAQFYPALLKKMLIESESDDTARQLPKVNTKERILEAALEIFSQKGFHTATTDEIAERAGVGKGTLYRYFETKEKLFEELVRLRLDELEKRAESIIDGQDDVLTMITKYIRTYFEFFDRNQHLYRLIVREQLDLGEQSPDMYFKKVMRALPQLKRKVYEGSQQGVLKDVDFQTVFYGTMGFVHGVIQKWLARDCSYSLVEELPGVLEVLFYGFVKKRKRMALPN